MGHPAEAIEPSHPRSQNRGSGAPNFYEVRICGRRMFGMFALAGCRPHDFPQYDANYREYAYVTNAGSGTVSVYDVVNVRVDREIAVGQNPTAVAANPARNEVYVVNTGTPNGQGSAKKCHGA